MAQQVARKKLTKVQSKMKKRYDCKTENKEFFPGDKVLALTPLLTSPFQAKYSGPYAVLERLSDQNYLISTPARRSDKNLFHVNLLKPYVSRDLSDGVSAMSAASHPVCLSISSGDSVVADLKTDDPLSPDDAMVTGRLKNSDYLKRLKELLGHLEPLQQEQLSQLITNFPSLFADTPSRTTLIQHDVDVGESSPKRQSFYRVHPERQKQLKAEVRYMIENNIAVPSDSSWASPYLLVSKSDGGLRFCTDFRKVNALTKTDSFPLPRMEDCVDLVGGGELCDKIGLTKRILAGTVNRKGKADCVFYNFGWFVLLSSDAFWFEKCTSNISTFDEFSCA
ncbi:uncharacterized protein LOC106526897 [Austrofundulus limnaeus]|uniref:Uncharacterized protein LOC106526897 n=1 Tax=Austrofundulus limnaeus TaxID=52670 RepID=A0A2I4CAR9_AUSLI|nr:PREDICTED: uncharacterized protein LOC106526897 [Austrofundulus limnaeus]